MRSLELPTSVCRRCSDSIHTRSGGAEAPGGATGASGSSSWAGAVRSRGSLIRSTSRSYEGTGARGFGEGVTRRRSDRS